ncbi:MAG: hemerythrin domain-containing protein [Tenuifilaceae bacterium]
MHTIQRTYVKPDLKLAGLIFENPSLLLMMEHFDLDIFTIQDKTIDQVCADNRISQLVFTSFANLYNGFIPTGIEYNPKEDIITIIKFLSRSHQYYKNEKYPEIRGYISQLNANNEVEIIKLIERFFDEYFSEVMEHLDYEDSVAFPYFNSLIDRSIQTNTSINQFSANDYREHHTDIESKLFELKNLFVKHLSLKGDRSIHRKLLNGLFELEHDLNIHSLIEETILVPLVREIERSKGLV